MMHEYISHLNFPSYKYVSFFEVQFKLLKVIGITDRWNF